VSYIILVLLSWSFFEVTEEIVEISLLGKPFVDFIAAAYIS
jgi:hypothetical protein